MEEKKAFAEFLTDLRGGTAHHEPLQEEGPFRWETGRG